MVNLLCLLGGLVLSLVQDAGRMMLFLLEGLGLAFVPPFRGRRFLQ